jgi:hypothetical protein
MHASLTAVGVAVVVLFVGCSQPISPASPTSVSSGRLSINSSGANATMGSPAKVVTARAGHDVPFKGSFEGVVTITSDTSTTRCGNVDGTGIATHLGLLTVTIPHCLTKATKSTIGSYHFIAANGDTLSANFSGQASLTSTPGVLSEVEDVTITGGTGRFAGATGGLTVERLADTIALTTSGFFKGTISY